MSITEEERNRVFQAFSSLVLVTIFFIFNPPILSMLNNVAATSRMQATSYLFAFCALIIALRFLMNKKEDIGKEELIGAYASLFGIILMFFGITLMFLGDLNMLNIGIFVTLGFWILLITTFAAGIAIGLTTGVIIIKWVHKLLRLMHIL